MENLVTNHIYAVLGIAGLVSMILTGCAIQAGDVLYKRFTRTQLKRQLGKLTPLIAVCLSVSLLTSQLTFGQTQTAPAPKLTRTQMYARLLGATNMIMVRLKAVCKTDECATLSKEGLALTADAQPKAAQGWLVEQERLDFHTKLESVLTQARAAMVANDPKAANVAKLNCPACQTKNVVFDQDRCDLCWSTFETLAEICALYLGWCETCALICLSTATLQLGNCLERFCGGT